MNRNDLERKKAQYIADGKEALGTAQQYLSDHADHWDSGREEHWLNLISRAEILLAKAMTIDELLTL